MNDVNRALIDLALRQRQVFTKAQARAVGLSRGAISRRIERETLVAVGNHTLTFAGVCLDWRARLLAGLLDLGPGALITGRPAAALLGLDGFPEGVDGEFLLVRSQRARRTPFGEVRSTPVIDRLDRTTVDGLAVTSATMTIVDLIGHTSEDELGNALDSACRRRLTAPSVVDRRLVALGRRGRPGVEVFNRVMAGAGVESWLERQFVKLLDRLPLPTPTRQRIYRKGTRTIARVDFDFAPLNIVVEVGGRRVDMSAGERRRQEHRRNELQLGGKVIFFFTTEDVRDDPDDVAATLLEAFGRRVA